MQNVIEEGDKLTSDQGMLHVTVTKVVSGKHGLLITGIGSTLSGERECYMPYELPALPDDEDEPGWYGWDRMSTYLPSGARVGILALNGSEPWGDIGYCESKWERTIETIRLEQMMAPKQSRPFTEQSKPWPSPPQCLLP